MLSPFVQLLGRSCSQRPQHLQSLKSQVGCKSSTVAAQRGILQSRLCVSCCVILVGVLNGSFVHIFARPCSQNVQLLQLLCMQGPKLPKRAINMLLSSSLGERYFADCGTSRCVVTDRSFTTSLPGCVRTHYNCHRKQIPDANKRSRTRTCFCNALVVQPGIKKYTR